MNKIEIIVGILAGIMFVGIIGLLGLDKDVTILMPMLTILLGYLVGRKQENIARIFTRNKEE